MPIGLTPTTFSTPRTVRDLIEGSFTIAKIIGQGEAMSDVQANAAGYRLNDIIEQAAIEKLFSAYQTEVQVPLVSGQATYTIGPLGAHVVAPRPVEVLSGFVRRDGFDYPVSLSHNKSDYDSLAIKGLQSGGWSSFVYYQASHPFGTIYVYPVPSDNQATLFLTVSAELTPFSGLNDVPLLPPVYFAWLQYALAERLAPDYGQIWTEKNQSILDDIRSALLRNNMKPAPRISVGIAELGQAQGQAGGSGSYNIRAERWGY